MKPFDVFISHHSGDKPWVIALKAALVARGVKVWLDHDEIRPGDMFVDALERGVQSSRSLALIVSPESLRSRWVKEEYNRALVLANSATSELRIIPCLLRSAELPGFISTRQRIDFSDPARFEERVDELCYGITGHKPDVKVGTSTSAGGEVTSDGSDAQRVARSLNDAAREVLVAARTGTGEVHLCDTYLRSVTAVGSREFITDQGDLESFRSWEQAVGDLDAESCLRKEYRNDGTRTDVFQITKFGRDVADIVRKGERVKH